MEDARIFSERVRSHVLIRASERFSPKGITTNASKVPFRGGTSGALVSNAVSCYKCGKPGHIARDCNGGVPAGGSNAMSNVCYGCNKVGHIRADCPLFTCGAGKCDSLNCRFQHKCSRCRQPHPVFKCPSQNNWVGVPAGGTFQDMPKYIHSVLNVDKFKNMLREHPDRREVDYIVAGFNKGFDIGVAGALGQGSGKNLSYDKEK